MDAKRGRLALRALLCHLSLAHLKPERMIKFGRRPKGETIATRGRQPLKWTRRQLTRARNLPVAKSSWPTFRRGAARYTLGPRSKARSAQNGCLNVRKRLRGHASLDRAERHYPDRRSLSGSGNALCDTCTHASRIENLSFAITADCVASCGLSGDGKANGRT